MTGPGWWIAAPEAWGPRRTSGAVMELAGAEPPVLFEVADDACITKGCRSPGAPRAACAACRRILTGKPVNCELGQVLVTHPDGSVWMCETPCILGYDRPSYRCVDVSGNVVQTLSNAPLEPPPREFTEAEERAFGQSPFAGSGVPNPSGAGFGGFFPPSGAGALTLGELSLADIGALVSRFAGGNLDLAGVVRALVVMALGQDRVRGALEQIAPGAADLFAPHFASVVTAQLTSSQAFAAKLETALAAGTEATTAAPGGLASKLLAGLVDVIGDVFRALVRVAQEIFGPVVEAFRDKVGDLAAGVQRVFREQLEQQRGQLPRNLDAVAGRAIGNALLAGTTAQLAAAGIELFYPTKNLGLNQFVGFIADFAGFGQITGPWFGPTVKGAIGNFAEHRAAELFRSEIPGAGEAQEQAAARHIRLGDYATVLAKHGLPSWWIQVLLNDVYVDPRPRELTELLNGGEAEPAWVAAKLKEIGWDDADVERGTRALLLKASRDGRQRWIGEGLNGYRDGRLSERELEGVLRAAGLNATHRDAYVRAARLARRGQIMGRVGARLVDQYVNDLMTRDATAALLVGLGFEVPEVTLRMLEGDLRRNLVQVRDERQLAEAEIRRLTSAALENLKRQFRAGLVTRDQFEVWAEALGYSAGYVQNIADLELLRGAPSSAEDLPPIGLGAVQETAREVARILEADVRRGRVDVQAAITILADLGLQHDLAGELLGIAQVLGIPVPGGLGIPLLGDDLGRSAFEQILGEVFQQIRHGEGGTGLLEQLLERLGLPAEHYRSSADVLRVLERLFFQGRSS